MRISNATYVVMKAIFAQANARTRRQLLRLRQEAQTDKAPRVALRLQALLLSADGVGAHEKGPGCAHEKGPTSWIK
jgi:hypothetical protein